MGERPTWPTHAEVAQSLIEQHAEDRFSSLVGTIQSYDPATQRADVVVGVRNPYQDPNGTGYLLREDFPVLPSVKVLFPRVGEAFLSFPVAPGDPVMLLFNTLSSEDWMNGDGRVVDVTDTRRQHVSHAVALLGMNVNSKVLQHTLAANAIVDTVEKPGIVLGYDTPTGTRLLMKPDAAMEIVHGESSVVRVEPGATTGAPEPVALASLVDGIVSSLKQHIANWIPVPNDGGASLKTHMATWNPASTAAAFLKAK